MMQQTWISVKVNKNTGVSQSTNNFKSSSPAKGNYLWKKTTRADFPLKEGN